MPEEWFEVSYINFDKAILHGRKYLGFTPLVKILTEEQKNKIVDMNEKHEEEMQKLLRSFVSE